MSQDEEINFKLSEVFCVSKRHPSTDMGTEYACILHSFAIFYLELKYKCIYCMGESVICEMCKPLGKQTPDTPRQNHRLQK